MTADTTHPIPTTVPWDMTKYGTTVTLTPICAGRETVLPRDAWAIALNLAAACGWEPRGALLQLPWESRRVDYVSPKGQIIEAEDMRTLAAAFRRAVAEYGTMDSTARETRRVILRHGVQGHGAPDEVWLAIRSADKLGLQVSPFQLVWATGANSNPATISRGLAVLADALDAFHSAKLDAQAPATWIHPRTPVEMVEVLPTSRPFALMGRAVTGGETLLVPAEDAAAMERRGLVRRLTSTEAAHA